MIRLKFAPLLALLGVAGCFPIDPDVNDKGEMLISRQEGFFIYQPRTGKAVRAPWSGEGEPVFARFAPNGADVLLIAEVKGEIGTEVRFDLVPLKGGKPRTLFKAREASDARFSPDGSRLAIVAYGGYDDQFMKWPEVHVVDVKTGQARALLKKGLTKPAKSQAGKPDLRPTGPLSERRRATLSVSAVRREKSTGTAKVSGAAPPCPLLPPPFSLVVAFARSRIECQGPQGFSAPFSIWFYVSPPRL